MNNSAAILRTLITYAICVPLALILGYVASRATYAPNTSDFSTIGIFALILIIPFLLRWHHLLLVFCWNLSATVFFLPGHPQIYLPMAGISLGIALLQRAISREQHFIRAPELTRPLVLLIAVAFFTAKLTGGIGLHALGSDVMGGRKYITLFAGIAGYFALTARRVPREHAFRYVALFFVGGMFSIIGDTVSYVPSGFYFLYQIFPPNAYAFSTGEVNSGMLRLSGLAGAAICFFSILLARYGIRGIFLAHKPWRMVLLAGSLGFVLAGGFRSMLLMCMITFAIQFFFLEKLHRTKLLPLFLFIGIFCAVICLPFANKLPLSFQRTLAFLPLNNLDLVVKTDAEASSEWRIEIWKAVAPQISDYLLVGKGYALSQEDFEFMGSGTRAVTAADWNSTIAGDFHSGPLSVIIPFGIWGVFAALWFFIAGWRALYRNYKYGDPALHNINMLLLASFAAKLIGFFFIFGSLFSDMQGFAGLLGLSISLNGGISPKPAPEPAIKTDRTPNVPQQLQPAISRA